MSQTNSVYTKGSLAKELNLNGLIRNEVVDGVVQEGQAEYLITKIIEQSNAKYEESGMGNKIIYTPKNEVAVNGDPTIKAQVQSAVAESGGVIKITFTDPNYQAFRSNDLVDTKFNGNQAKVIEGGIGFMRIKQADGFATPVVGDFAAGKIVIQRDRSVDIRGTQAPEGVYQVPQVWENYLSIWDDGGQENLFDSAQRTVISNAGEYVSVAPIKNALGRFFRNGAMKMYTSRAVNPASNGYQTTATSGIIEQIKNRGTYAALNSVITRSEFEDRVAQWLLSNPHQMNDNRIIKTGRIGMAQIGEWYKEQMKYDVGIAVSFTDGSVNGLNATKIFIAGFGFVNVVHDIMQDMNFMGEKSAISGYSGMPKTSGDFYMLDFSPVQMQYGGTAPAFQKFYLRNKYFYGMQQGMRPTEMLADVLNGGGTALTLDNLELSSTNNDFNSFRIYSICGINVMNGSAHVYLENKV